MTKQTTITKFPKNVGQYMTIEDIALTNKQNGYHFFDKSTMKFFKSRILSSYNNTSKRVVFITSEINPSGKKAFTVRVADKKKGLIRTVGNFHSISSKARAEKALRRITNLLITIEEKASEAA